MAATKPKSKKYNPTIKEASDKANASAKQRAEKAGKKYVPSMTITTKVDAVAGASPKPKKKSK